LQQLEQSPQDAPCGQSARGKVLDGSGAERGGQVKGTENMKPRL
jgi:hypothetical protein